MLVIQQHHYPVLTLTTCSTNTKGDYMSYKLKAFTLTELLIALGIIGAVAAISIPSLMNTINNRLLVTQLKSNITAFQQLASDQVVMTQSRSLADSAFKDPAKLLTDEYFAIQKQCTDPAKDCWKTTATTGKIQYKVLTKATTNIAGPTFKSIILKNGAVVGYTTYNLAITGMPDDKIIGEFCFDVNGNDYPNISGRDYFCTFVTKKGKLLDSQTPNMTTANKITKCKTGEGSNYCYGAIVDSGWTMPY